MKLQSYFKKKLKKKLLSENFLKLHLSNQEIIKKPNRQIMIIILKGKAQLVHHFWIQKVKPIGKKNLVQQLKIKYLILSYSNNNFIVKKHKNHRGV